MTLNDVTDDDSSSLSNDECSQNICFDDEEVNSDNQEDEPAPIFDESKEVCYDTKYTLLLEEAVNLSNIYILHLDAYKQGQSLKVASALSDFSCKIYNFESNNKCTQVLNDHENKIVDIKFGKNRNEFSGIVYTGSEDGTIKLWDLRTKEKCISCYKDDTDSKLKPLSCFDVSCDGRFLVAGTEVITDDSFLLFWDVRTTKLLGGYWDTHQGDITQVKFHPNEEKTVISGSTDGIINLFDVTQTSEKDALQLTFNTNSSVSILNWLKDKCEDWIFSCITHTEDLQLWHTTDSKPCISILRNAISKSMNIEPDVYCQVINCHQLDNDGNILLLVGNNHRKGEHLQSFNISIDSSISPRTLFKNNKQIVRCSWYDSNDGTLITGGEAGIISVWSLNEIHDVGNNDKCSLKDVSRKSLKNISHKPY
ncbi:WD repeat-containing protein 89 [Daktulosphaira vitifoliae]|uniref:WD repeat-containing protein 89 n=1 Tax=Daktulosphaira vitifoliae TaxID=58002 RepID=UPI0021AAC553|nr:WD repeat-containing protein 89 [Daktulosphaira vitifoliae]